ncbi:MAG: hypothetical protein QME79_02570 [Bacillota bacterium]|nr:hypothetical protein [Bacillota bacterium]
MNQKAERRLRAVYIGGTVFFTFLAWLFRINLVIGLVAMPVVIHLIMAERARRAAKGVAGTPLASLYRLVIVRELLATGLFAAAAGYVAVRMEGSPRLAWWEGLVAALLVAYALMIRTIVQRARTLAPAE